MIQSRRDQVPPVPSSCSPYLAPTGRGSASTWPLQGLVDVQNCSFHLVDQFLGRPRSLYQVRNRRFFVRSNDVRLHKPLETDETANAFRTQDRAFSFPRAPDPNGATKWAVSVRRNPRSAVRRWRWLDATQGPTLTFVPALQANTGALRASFFSRSTAIRTVGGNRPETGCFGVQAKRSAARPSVLLCQANFRNRVALILILTGHASSCTVHPDVRWRRPVRSRCPDGRGFDSGVSLENERRATLPMPHDTAATPPYPVPPSGSGDG